MRASSSFRHDRYRYAPETNTVWAWKLAAWAALWALELALGQEVEAACPGRADRESPGRVRPRHSAAAVSPTRGAGEDRVARATRTVWAADTGDPAPPALPPRRAQRVHEAVSATVTLIMNVNFCLGGFFLSPCLKLMEIFNSNAQEMLPVAAL